MNDLNYFALDWNQAAEVLGAVVLLSIFVERFLAVVFENEWYRRHLQARHIKEPIALATALLLCFAFEFDAVAVLMKQGSWSVIGTVLTAGVIAGGSKASIKLFIDVMKVRNLNPDEEEQERKVLHAKRERKIREAGITKRKTTKKKAGRSE